MSVGIDVTQKDLDTIASAAGDYAKLVVATTISINQGGFGGMGGLTGAQVATLVSRYFAARNDSSKTGV